jgi:ferric-dicitrate binding protein FerR (iron transport regulator)
VSGPRYARLASRLFVREGGESSHPVDPQDRERAIRAIAAALSARNSHRRRVRWLAGLAAVAAVATVAVGLRHTRVAAPTAVVRIVPAQIVAHSVQGATSVIVSGTVSPLAEETPVAEGSRLITPSDGRATLAFSTGTTVVVGGSSDMAITGDNARQMVRLNAGSLRLHVAKLAPLQRFIVGTTDAEVEVRGTRFSVAVAPPNPACGNGTTTRVTVIEGVVVVRHDGIEERVLANEVWPSGCASTAPPSSPLSIHPAFRQSPNESLPSTLAEQNDLFAEGLAARRRGDASAALLAFDRLMERYPSSALAESAQVESMRLLRAASPSRARDVARQYLASYARGFARAEAEALLTDAP